MPSKNILKIYVSNSFYHIYNRGVAKNKIFLDKQDYKVFLSYLKESLSQPKIKRVKFTLQGQSFKGEKRQPKNFKNKIELVSFCLMPNHFHLLLKQKDKQQIESFMRSTITRYSQYFNKRHDRVGHVFQGRYKAILVTKDEYLLHLTRYIHLNPKELDITLAEAYSSYAEYLGLRKTSWVKPHFVLDYFNKATFPEFKKVNSYKSFVEYYKKDSKKILGDFTLE